MPTAPDYLREMFEDDAAAWAVLREHYDHTRGGIIYPKDHKRQVTEKEKHALDYLWLEWDYGFMPSKIEAEKTEAWLKSKKNHLTSESTDDIL